MKNEDINFFENMKKENGLEENFFLKGNVDFTQRPDFVKTKRHLNDYDLNLLEENAYKDLPDTTFRLEYEISKIEKELKNIGAKILAAKTIMDKEEQIALVEQKAYLETYYDSLIKQYNNKGASAKVSGFISYMFGNSNYKNDKKSFVSQFFSLLPRSIKKISEIETSLHNLKSINKSTDDLLNFKMTESQDFGRYSQLSKYLIKANSLQTEIEKFIKNQK